MFRHIRQLKRENDEMRAALRWYAARSTWRRSAKNPKGTPRRWEKSPAAYDRGERALSVILQIEQSRLQLSLFARLRKMLIKRSVISTLTQAPRRKIHTPAPLLEQSQRGRHLTDQPISPTLGHAETTNAE